VIFPPQHFASTRPAALAYFIFNNQIAFANSYSTLWNENSNTTERNGTFTSEFTDPSHSNASLALPPCVPFVYAPFSLSNSLVDSSLLVTNPIQQQLMIMREQTIQERIRKNQSLTQPIAPVVPLNQSSSTKHGQEKSVGEAAEGSGMEERKQNPAITADSSKESHSSSSSTSRR
jgi:hypothetical protein